MSEPPREIELKLELDPTRVRALSREASRSLGDPPEGAKTLTSVYFDTRKHALRRRGLSLRVRHDGGRRIQTLKASGGAAAGLFDRPEWESEVAGDEPDPAGFADPRAEAALAVRGRLAPVFRTEIARTAWSVQEGASEVTVVVDEGEVTAGPARERIAEIELELGRGSPDDLFRVARRLAESGHLRLAARSKSDHGYALADGGTAVAVKAGSVQLDRSMSAGQAFQAIARSCLGHFRLNEGALSARRDTDALHQARVAIRRLRSAMSLFRPVISDGETERLKGELRKLSGVLGEARNLDVFLSRVVAAEAARDPGEPGLAAFQARLVADREAAYDRVLRRLAGKRFRLFTIDLAAWIESGEWRRADERAGARDVPAWEFAGRVLDRRRKRVRKRGRGLEALSPEARHQVRIDAKKLRYASEFFGTLVTGRKARRRHVDFVAALQELQDHLGELNDIQTGHEMTARLARVGGDGPPAALFAAGHAAGEQDAREPHLLAAAAKAHRRFREAKPFWR